jgi:negative regulator of sigma E activity
MTNKESLSALIDGEATEIEVHRLVREFGKEASLSVSWSVYQQIRATLRGETPMASGRGLEIEQHQRLFSKISQAIEEEDNYQRATMPKLNASAAVGGSVAIAACLVVAVFFGIRTDKQEQIENQGAANVTIEFVDVANDSVDSQIAELVELDEEKQRQLRAYLKQHDRMSRMDIKPQLVKYKEHAGN